MALVVVRYVAGPEEHASLDFQALSNDEFTKAPSSIVHVRPDFQIDYSPDTMSGGWIVREVDPGDPNPLLAVSFDQDNKNPIYFSTIDPNSD